ncbi:catechol 2,3-dioxygenase [Oceanobacter mangrovi]|uniref:catechol 2,3-dioxygenase n=1 Tax=Oceanobacter mangrovi TaxID=2862510 RepID=UPI001C8CFFFC|nr:catechol 2,3-dioxygenase [Oceanobacter mangrovi]
MKYGVMRPGHVQIRVLDMDEAVKHYCDLMGLIEMDRDDQGRVYLKAWTEVDKYSVILSPSDSAGMDFMSFKVVSEEALDRLRGRLLEHAVEIEEIPAGELKDCGRRIRFKAPTGHTFELFASKAQTGKWGVSNTNPEAWPRDLKGMAVVRYDHCLLYGPDVPATTKLFTEVLGFELAERVIAPDESETLIGSFMSVGMKAHDIAFIENPQPNQFHHSSYFLETWEDVLKAADLISMTDTPIDIGPTRHGLTNGRTIYFFDPSGNRTEVFAGGNYTYPDHEPITWTADQLGKAIFYHDRELNERFLTVTT